MPRVTDATPDTSPLIVTFSTTARPPFCTRIEPSSQLLKAILLSVRSTPAPVTVMPAPKSPAPSSTAAFASAPMAVTGAEGSMPAIVTSCEIVSCSL